eukprot:TRINITY_DN63358_c0_g1_i1.p1 TRINITY_DN63358_c0_g1~~TRINITY_DN63358_c0_g1_i1.p1  ORF type:complete len:123 (+),score=14.56 TRINITY_DN63358_c0_g1_i1:2-370(+)
MSETEQYQDEPPQVAQRVFGSDIIDALAKNSSMVFRAVGKVESVSVDAKTLEFSTVDGKVFTVNSTESSAYRPGQLLELFMTADDGVLSEAISVHLSENFSFNAYGKFLDFAKEHPGFFFPQ